MQLVEVEPFFCSRVQRWEIEEASGQRREINPLDFLPFTSSTVPPTRLSS